MRHSEIRVAKNTLFLYVRMLLILLINLYTSRVILKTLGFEDFGIYIKVDRKYSDNTKESYLDDIKKCLMYLKKEPDRITDDDIFLYLKHLDKENLNSKTISRNISSLKTFFKYMNITNKMNYNPISNITLYKL